MTAPSPLPGFEKPTIRRNRLGLAAVAVVVVALFAFPIGIAVGLGDASYLSLQRAYPGALTAVTATVLRVIADVASWLTAGSLVCLLFLRARTGKTRLELGAPFELSVLKLSSGMWFVAAVALVVFDGADANGVPVTRTVVPGTLAFLVDAAYLPKAWLVVAALALVILFVSSLATRWQGLLVPAWCAAIALLAPVVVGQVQVGPNHDLGSDAAALQTVAAAAYLAPLSVLALRIASGRLIHPETLNRLGRIGLVAMPVLIATELVLTWFKLSETSLPQTPTGVMSIARLVLLIAVAVVLTVGVGSWKKGTLTETRVTALITSAALCSAALLAIAAAMTRIPPPQYFYPSNIMHILLGFEVDIAPGIDVLFASWRLNLLFAVIAAAAITVYYIALAQLRRRGDSWPAGRTVAWTLGWVVVVVATSSGWGKYSGSDFGIHMMVHMALNMLAPLLLVMGGVITLMLRASKPSGKNGAAGFHEWLTAALNWPVLKFIYNPILVFILFIASYYGLYLTGLFEEIIPFHWAHQAMNLHFLIVGYLYYGLVIGVDRPPRPLPHLGKLGFVLAAMPFHAFFGVILMTSTDVIAKNFYETLGLPWANDLLGSQYVGGGVAWAGGELPLLLVIIALGIQWSRQDSKEAQRTDRHLDSGLNDDFEDYNAMLAKLNARSAPSPSSGTETPK